MTKFKRYLVFGGQGFVLGGWSDFLGSYDLRTEAQAEASKAFAGGLQWPWGQIMDSWTGKLEHVGSEESIDA